MSGEGLQDLVPYAVLWGWNPKTADPDLDPIRVRGFFYHMRLMQIYRRIIIISVKKKGIVIVLIIIKKKELGVTKMLHMWAEWGGDEKNGEFGSMGAYFMRDFFDINCKYYRLFYYGIRKNW